MVVLRICVLVCASTEQFPSKSVFIKTVSVKSSNLQSMLFIVLRRMSLMIVRGAVENVMRSRFNIKTATANRI